MFERLAAASRRTVERVHGDQVVVYPSDRPRGPNAARTAVLALAYGTIVCFVENTLAENDALSRPLTGEGRMMHAAPSVFGSITLVDGKKLEAGFFLKRAADGAVFEIVSFKPDGLGAVYATLNRMKTLPEAG